MVELTMREGFYKRKSDSRRVRAGDWSDGTVSWMIDPLPIFMMGTAVGTCSLNAFEKDHSRVEDTTDCEALLRYDKKHSESLGRDR